jgi:phospholipase/carboxylesterase
MSDLERLGHLVRPSAGEPQGALVLFHGRGADERDLFPLLDELDPGRRLLGLTVRGPLSLPPGGAHWYVLGGVGTPERESFLGTDELLGRWLAALARETGIPPEATVLGGFSQGAVMTYAMGLGAGRPRPAALVALSGFMPAVEGFDLDLTAPLPPAAIGHGVYDRVIPVEFGRRARQRLEKAGAEVAYRESLMAHSIDPGFLEELRPWIRAAIERAAVGRA